jgi:outer membrane protein TolC
MRKAPTIGCFALFAVLTAGVAFGQEVRVPAADLLAAREYQAAPKPVGSEISLSDAVRLTINHSPRISRSARSLDQATGRQRENRGVFDSTVTLGPRFAYRYQQLLPAMRGYETEKRQTIRNIAHSFGALTDELRARTTSPNGWKPRCPSGLSFGADTLILDRLDAREITMLGVNGDLRANAAADLQRSLGGINISTICSDGIEPSLPADVYADLLRRIDVSGGLGLEGVIESISQMPYEARLLQVVITDTVATRARLALERLGEVPIDDLQYNTQLDLGLFKPFRNGLTLAGGLQVQSQERDYLNKPLDPSFGGFDAPPQFYSAASLSLNLPLGRGRGRQSVQAPERAADFLVGAGREELRHSVSEDVFRTTVAYLNVVAARERLELLEESAERQRAITELTRQQVEDEELPRMELDRARARASRVASSVSQARSALVAARISLAEAMGMEVSGPDEAPLAAGGFAVTMAIIPPAEELVQKAHNLRRDIRMLDRQQAASAVLATGARADLRHRFDFSLNLGIADLYDSPFFRYLPDEANPIYSDLSPAPAPGLSPVRYASGRGYYRTASGRWEPYLVASFSLQLPLANNAARGRSAQAEATLGQARIRSADIRRVVGENVIEVRETLDMAAKAVAWWEKAVANGQETLAAAMERFRDREMTLINTLLTEEELTSDKLQLVAQRQAYYSALARLKHETGELVLVENEGPGTEVIAFQTSGLVSR